MDQLPNSVRSRLRAQPPVGAHPDADTLNAFAEQRLAPAEREIVVTHMATCADCREIASFAASAAPAQEIAAVDDPIARRAWWAIPAYQWGAAAAAAGALAVGLLVMQPPKKSPVTVRTEVAQSVPAPRADESQKKVPETSASPKEQDSVAGTASFAPPRREARTRAAQPALQDKLAKGEASAQVKARAPELSTQAAVAAQPSVSTNLTNESYTGRPSVDTSTAQLQSGAAGGYGGGLFRAPEAASASSSTPPAAGNGVAAAKDNAPAEPLEVKQKTDAEIANLPVAPPPASESAESAYSASRAADELAVGRAGKAVETHRAKTSLASAKVSTPWRITNGRLEHFDGSRKAWNEVSVGTASRLAVVASFGYEVWVGGTDGMMFYSNDRGAHWIPTSTGGWSKDATITGLTPTALRSVEVHLSNGERWRSADGGASWTKYR